MRIAIIGAGNIGNALGRGWASAGHEIVFGVRDPNEAKVQGVVRSVGGRARAATVRDAVAPSEVVTLATPWRATKDALTAAGSLSGKILVDATNPLKPDLSGLVLGHTTSAAEQVAAWTPGRRSSRRSTRSGPCT
jgi:8-hydroxy-5-deazaflavin:NADPH oxidoreductase